MEEDLYELKEKVKELVEAITIIAYIVGGILVIVIFIAVKLKIFFWQ
jgi:VIT1/CCC1 family predicted Fe2+/Mn2+ transporter